MIDIMLLFFELIGSLVPLVITSFIATKNPYNRQVSVSFSSLKYTLLQNGHHFSILLFDCKLAHLASLSNVKFKRIFYLEQGQKGQFAIKQKNTKMVAILE